MALIVNADDFGISEEVNAAIAEAFEKGLVDRTTLMVNMPDAAGAMEIARKRGFADKVGLHLNLTSGKPLTREMAADRLMCGQNGEYTAEFAGCLKTRFFLPKDTRDNIGKELRAQLDEYGKLGGTLWHIDSHHHVHTDPSVWSVLQKVLKDYPVTSVRLGRNMYRGGNPLMHLYKAMLNASIRRFCNGRPRYFGSARDYAAFEPYIANMPPDEQAEIMVHPVYDDNGNVCDKCMDQLLVMKPVRFFDEAGS